jgi:GNAT superfamily N-acetyltransferase
MTDTMPETRPGHALLADGRSVEIRPACVADHAGIMRLLDEMPAENLRLRLFGTGRRVGGVAAGRICGPSRPGHRALLACHGDRVVGLAEYEHAPTATSPEVAVAVAGDFQHDGLAMPLLAHLFRQARQDGVVVLTASTFWTNHAVLNVFTDLGLSTTRRFEGYEVHCTVRL